MQNIRLLFYLYNWCLFFLIFGAIKQKSKKAIKSEVNKKEELQVYSIIEKLIIRLNFGQDGGSISITITPQSKLPGVYFC